MERASLPRDKVELSGLSGDILIDNGKTLSLKERCGGILSYIPYVLSCLTFKIHGFNKYGLPIGSYRDYEVESPSVLVSYTHLYTEFSTVFPIREMTLSGHFSTGAAKENRTPI